MISEQFIYGTKKTSPVPYFVHPAFRGGSMFDQYFFNQMKNGCFSLLSEDNIINSRCFINNGSRCILEFLKENDCFIVAITFETPTVISFVYDFEFFIFELVEIGTILVKTDSLKDAKKKMKTLSQLFSEENIDGIVGEENYIRIFYDTIDN